MLTSYGHNILACLFMIVVTLLELQITIKMRQLTAYKMVKPTKLYIDCVFKRFEQPLRV